MDNNISISTSKKIILYIIVVISAFIIIYESARLLFILFFKVEFFFSSSVLLIIYKNELLNLLTRILLALGVTAHFLLREKNSKRFLFIVLILAIILPEIFDQIITKISDNFYQKIIDEPFSMSNIFASPSKNRIYYSLLNKFNSLQIVIGYILKFSFLILIFRICNKHTNRLYIFYLVYFCTDAIRYFITSYHSLIISFNSVNYDIKYILFFIITKSSSIAICIFTIVYIIKLIRNSIHSSTLPLK